MVLGEPRKGLKVTYCTDSRPTDNIVEHAKNADLFICEGMYGEPDKLVKAKEYKHMTMYEAAKMARSAEVKERLGDSMGLTAIKKESIGEQVLAQMKELEN